MTGPVLPRSSSQSFILMFADMNCNLSYQSVSETVEQAMQKPHKSLADLCSSVLGPLFEKRPDLQMQVTAFLNRFPEHCECSSWQSLKKMHDHEKMQQFQQFRTNANDFINTLTQDLGKELGLQDIQWVACGTKGYNSDVDISIKMASNPPNIMEAVQYKLLRDLVHYYVMNGLSGVQLDTECYIPHVAEFDITKYLIQPMSYCYFQTGEKAAVVMQRYMSLHKNPGLYEESKQKDIKGILNKEEQAAMLQLHHQVETLMNQFTDKGPHEIAYISLQLAKYCDTLQRKIAQAKRTNEFQKLDALHLKLQSVLIILAALQTGGTFSVSEGKATLFEDGGQLCDKVLTARKGSLSEYYQRKPDALFADIPEFKRKYSIPLMGTLEHSDEFARCIIGKDAQEMLQPDFKKPSIQTLLIAAYEESIQLEDALYPDMDIVFSSKYALRVTRHLLQALKECKAAPPHLLNRAIKLERISASLEKCKRGVAINSQAATILSVNIITSKLGRRGSVDFTLINAKVSNMFRNFDFDGPFFGKVLTKEEHLRFLVDTLAKAKDLFIDVKDPDLLAILQAHAAIESPHLAQVHKEATELTLASLNLVEKESIRQFHEEILSLGCDVRNFYREMSLLVISTPEMASFFDFAKILNDLRKEG